MRIRNPRKDLTNYENDHCIALRSEKACVWVIKCKYCNKNLVKFKTMQNQDNVKHLNHIIGLVLNEKIISCVNSMVYLLNNLQNY